MNTTQDVQDLRIVVNDMQRVITRMQAQINNLQRAESPSRITRLRRRLAAIILGGPVPS